MIHLRTLGSIGLRNSAGVHLRSVLAQPKRLVLLALLSLSQDGMCRRDRLLGLFWPDHGSKRARAALRQAARFLRREVGQHVSGTVGLNVWQSRPEPRH